MRAYSNSKFGEIYISLSNNVIIDRLNREAIWEATQDYFLQAQKYRQILELLLEGIPAEISTTDYGAQAELQDGRIIILDAECAKIEF
jgi:hypothetical protein